MNKSSATCEYLFADAISSSFYIGEGKEKSCFGHGNIAIQHCVQYLVCHLEFESLRCVVRWVVARTLRPRKSRGL